MAFLRQWLLILCLLLLGGGPLLAASRESRAYGAAVADAQDRMWSRAETEFAQFVKRFPKSTNAPMAVLLEAQAQFQQAKYDEAIGLLSDTNHLAWARGVGIADQYARWTGEAQFAAGQYEVSAATFVKAARDYPKSPSVVTMVVSAAVAYEKLGDWPKLDALLEATNGVFQRAMGRDPDNQQVAAGRLLLARSKFEQKNYPAALVILNSLNLQTLTADQEGNQAQQLYGVMMAMGNDDGALAATTNLMNLADLELRASGVASHALLLEKKGQLSDAITAWTNNLAAGVPLDKQRQAILKTAELAAELNDFTNAAGSLGNYVVKFPDSPLAELALLTSGEMDLKNFLTKGQTNLTDVVSAQACFDQLLNRSTNSPLAGQAYLDRGWCEWFATNYPAGAVDFRLASEKTLPTNEVAVAIFKLGDTFYAQGDYESAQQSYVRVLEEFADVPEVMQSLEQRSLYQILRSSLELTNGPAAEQALNQLLEKYPTGQDTAPGLLLAGEGYADFTNPPAARAVLQKFEAQFPNSTLRPDVDFAVARTYENEQNWAQSVTQLESWLKNYPGNALLPQVQFALGRANFEAGNESTAFEVYTNFVASFPTNDLAPLAQWWVADHFFRAGEWVGAETNYEAVFQNQSPVWQTNVLALPARLMAGRAAMGRQGYADAVAYFKTLIEITNCPPGLGVQARFAYGSALMILESTDTNNPLANVEEATNTFNQIIQMYPTNDYGARAWGELGNGDRLLGDFDAATNAYAQAFNLDSAETSVHSEAMIGFGLALENKAKLASGDDQRNLLEQALNNYLDLLREESGGFWVKKAGLQAAAVAEALGDWTTAISIYNRLKEDLPQLKDEMDAKIAAANAQMALKKN